MVNVISGMVRGRVRPPYVVRANEDVVQHGVHMHTPEIGRPAWASYINMFDIGRQCFVEIYLW